MLHGLTSSREERRQVRVAGGIRRRDAEQELDVCENDWLGSRSNCDAVGHGIKCQRRAGFRDAFAFGAMVAVSIGAGGGAGGGGEYRSAFPTWTSAEPMASATSTICPLASESEALATQGFRTRMFMGKGRGAVGLAPPPSGSVFLTVTGRNARAFLRGRAAPNRVVDPDVPGEILGPQGDHLD